MLNRLPTELAEKIVEYIDDPIDLKNLSEVCWFMYDVTVKKRYEIFTPGPDSTFDGRKWSGHFNIKPFLKRPRYPARHLQHVRELHFNADLREALLRGITHSCNHMRYVEQNLDGRGMMEAENALERDIRLIFQRLEKGVLRSFSWCMGACPPNRVLGALGYVHRHHSQLESISLITDGTCEWNTNGTAPVWLQHLTSLKHLSWRAIFSQSDLGHLRNCLWENYHNLESLELEFFDFAETKRRWAAGSTPDAAPGNFFARDILLIQQNALQTRFPKLHTLSLGTFNWEGHTAELAWAFNVADLRTLRLFNCSETDVLFARVYNACESSGIRLKLTTFEFQDHNRQLHKLYGRPNYFKGFLDMVNSGTENLYIYIPDHALAVIESLIACRDRPRRFVFRVDSWDDEFNDLLNKLQEYVKNPVLEFLGLPGCLLLPVMRQLGESPQTPDEPQLKLKLLHVRPDETTREAVLSFADWAFRNPRFARTLKVIVWGDFNDSKRKKDRVYLCRNVACPLAETDKSSRCDFPDDERAYREVNVNGDNVLWAFIKDEMPFLEACDRRRAETDTAQIQKQILIDSELVSPSSSHRDL